MSEEETIQKLLEQFNTSNQNEYNWILSRAEDEEARILYKKCIEVMHGLDFVKLENGPTNLGNHTYITLTSKGRSVIIKGGYKKYLVEQTERDKQEKEIYENTKENLKIAKSSKTWVIVGVVFAAIALVLSIIWHYS